MKFKGCKTLLILLATLGLAGYTAWANLPCVNDGCPSNCPCQGKNGQGPRTGNGNNGTQAGNNGQPPALMKSGNNSVHVSVNFGSPATENIYVVGQFSIYTKKPSPTIFTPQSLQYRNYLLDRISQNVISETYKDQIGLPYYEAAGSGMMMAAAGDEYQPAGAGGDFGGGYGSNILKDNLGENVTHQVRMIGPDRTPMIFVFYKDNPVGVLTGEAAYMGYKLVMTNQDGESVTSHPYFYDLYIGYGYFIRYTVSDGMPHSYHTPSGRVLMASSPSVGLEGVYDADGTIRQIWSFSDGLADVVVTEVGVSYEIRFYAPSQVGSKVDGIYQASGSPYTVLRIEKPSGGSNTDVWITRTAGGQSYLTKFRYSYAADGWTMTSPGDLSIDSKATVLDYSGLVKTVSETIKASDGEVARKKADVYQTYDFGERIVSSTLDPDGLNFRSAFTYYTDRNGKGRYGKVATENFADGSWKSCQYNDEGWETQIVSSWLNSAFNSAAAEGQALSISYDPLDSRDKLLPEDKRPRTLETKILGVTVQKTFNAYYFDGNAFTEVKEAATTPGAAWGDAANLRSTWVYYPKGDCTSASAGRLQRATRPDGTTESYTYEYGNLQQGAEGDYTFTPGSGNAVRVYVTQGTTEHPEGIAWRTTREEQLYDVRGNRVYTATQINTGSGYETANWTRNGYDEQHRQLSELKSNGELAEKTWNCCQLASETFPDGTQYTYVYDAMLRQVSKTKVGVGSQPDLVTTYTYNAASQIVSETATGGELSETQSTGYNLAGLPVQDISKYGLVTTFSYLSAVNTGSNRRGLSATVTLPGGATQTLAYYCDKQPESMTGNASVPEYYRYGVNADGSFWKKTLIGGGDSPRWKQRVVGMNQEVISEIASGYNGNVIENRNYNAKNQLVKVTKTGSAPILIEYDAIGEWSRTGINVNGDDVLAPASNDRIVDREQAYLSDNGWWKSVTQKTYATAGSDVATVYSVEKERLSGTGDEIRATDVYGNVTTTVTTLDRANKRKIKTVTHPDSTVSEELITLNGLDVSERTTSNLTTTLSYDALERLVGVTEPRIGTTTIAYHARGWLASATNPAGNTMEFNFDETSGRLNWIKNPLNQYTRYAYNTRNQITRVWGEAGYPLEFTYDQYGQQTELKTYRTGSFSGAVWPELYTQGDTTTWVYDTASGKVTAKIDAKGKATQYTYTTDGKLATRTWARLVSQQPLVTTYSYDPATGQKTGVDYSDSTQDIIYTYNRLGQFATIQDAAGTRTFAYNTGFDRISETITGIYNKVLNYDYSAGEVKGRYQGFSLDNLINSTYTYDSYGRLNQIGTGAGAFGYTRLSGSELIENLTRPNGVNTAWSYEAHRDLVTQVANGSVSTFGYTNDALGRRTSMSRSGSAFPMPDILTYGYNDRSEVVSAQSNVDANYVYSYNYDPIGNRLTAGLAGTNWSYTTNVVNQYTQLVKGSDTFDPTYDDDGNMLTRMGWTQRWNGENRLIETVKGTQRLTFAYDYMGRRIEKKIYTNEVLTKHIRFVYNGYKLVEELDALDGNASLRRYTWQPDVLGLDVPLSVYDIEQDKTYFYHTDANKNITELTDSEGIVVAHYEYSPFGQIAKQSGDYAETNPFRFSSEYYDTETKLVYYNYRYYDPVLGRWLSRDPIEENGGWNLYEMTANGPIISWDNLGGNTFGWKSVVGAVLALAGGVLAPGVLKIVPVLVGGGLVVWDLCETGDTINDMRGTDGRDGQLGKKILGTDAPIDIENGGKGGTPERSMRPRDAFK